MVAVDAGPLIALFDRDDHHHTRAVDFFKSFDAKRFGLLTNIAVITETAAMLDFARGSLAGFLDWAGKAMDIDEATGNDLGRISAIIARYRDLPADFADASLLAMCERRDIQSVASLDAHFDVYRTANRRRLENIFPRGRD